MVLKKRDITTISLALGALFLLCIFFNHLAKEALIREQNELYEKETVLLEETAVKRETKVSGGPLSEKDMYATSSIQVPVLVYHSVRPHMDKETKLQDAYDVTPELFEKHLQYLKEHHIKVITMAELTSYFTKGYKLKDKEKKVVISFDDGWENQYTYAYPLLKKYGYTAIFYVYTKPLGYKHFLTWDQIKEIRQNGMEIGSHTLSHPFFKKLTEDEVRYEITESKKVLEEKLGFPVPYFASPFGYSNDKIEEYIKAAGYDTGRTIFRGSFQKDKYALRGDLVTDEMNDFAAIFK